MSWRGITKGFPQAKDFAMSVKDSQNNHLKFTWFLRCDEQMNVIYGKYTWLLENFLELWRRFKEEGDEIGWHPHLWKWDNVKNIWYSELEDQIWIENCLRNGHAHFLRYFVPKSVRMGWDFHSNFTMNILEELGVVTDLSALPKKKWYGDYLYDWKVTDENPYFPSKIDYRTGKPIKSSRKCDEEKNSDSLKILEIPVSLTPISASLRIVRLLKGVISTNPTIRLDREMYMVATKHPSFFMPGVKKKFHQSKKDKCPSLLVSYFHPNELLKSKGLFSINNFKRNIKSIKSLSKRYGVPFRFLTAIETAEELLMDKG